MIKELEKAFAAARELPEEDQLELLDFIERKIVERKVAEGIESFDKHGGKPAAEVFDRLTRKYGG
jgi:hypothetical protein